MLMKTTQFSNYFFKKIFNLTFIYFTFWTLVIQALYYIGILKRYQESVLLLVGMVAFIGLVLTYIYPRKIKLKPIDYTIKGDKLQIVDLICHQLPFIIFLVMYDKRIKPDNLILGSVILLIYVILFNPLEVYDYKCDTNKFKRKNCKQDYITGIVMTFTFAILIMFAINNGVFK